jgi:hypothetical protein
MIWRPERGDRWPILLILLAPLVVAAPLLLGLLNPDPALFMAQMTLNHQALHPHGLLGLWQGGLPTMEGNAGITTQALGHLSAQSLLHGRSPWWNPYTGVGSPLAAEYQGASFFPPTLLLLLPQGMLLEHLLLQMLAGWGTYALLRQLGLGRLGALAGGLVFAFDGTLAMYDSAAALPLPFLPWSLLGVERAWIKAGQGLSGGWRLLGLALGLSLLAGFPEAAYLNGLLVLAWSALRLFQARADRRLGYVRRLAMGGAAGLGLAAPQIFAFAESLSGSNLWLHGSSFLANKGLGPGSAMPSLVAPYVYGPFYKFAADWPRSFMIWARMGGYVTALMLVVAAYGVAARRGLLSGLLLAWVLFTAGRMLNLQPMSLLWTLVPGAKDAVVYRYIQPSLEMALTLLMAFGLDALARGGGPRRTALILAGAAAAAVAASGLAFRLQFPGLFRTSPSMQVWIYGSLIWAAASLVLGLALLSRPAWRWSAPALALMLAGEAALMFAVPTLGATPAREKLDMAAVDFLRGHLGLNRFYTLGPIAANYGAYFGIAQINHNYVPDPQRWVDWDKAHLGAAADEMLNFAFASEGQTGHLQSLARNLPAFEWAGVKYVVTRREHAPMTGDAAPPMTPVYGDSILTIFELPDPAPYFQALGGDCQVQARGRGEAAADCRAPAVLLRRELFYPGWTARVDGAPAAIAPYQDLFQAVALPRGHSLVRYAYAPPHILWMWLAFWIAAGGLLASAAASVRARLRTRRTSSQGHAP